MKKHVAMCVGMMLAGLVGCGGTFEEQPETPPPPTESALDDPGASSPEDDAREASSDATDDATELVGFDGPSEPLEGLMPPEDDGPVTQMECGKPTYESTRKCRSSCYRVSTCGDGRPMYKCNYVTYEAWYDKFLWTKRYAYWRKSTADSWWCANSAPNNCPGFCN